ncbi:MAG TPA: S1/P1 nuclease [Candidatus Binataceae bacterium]|nr:S1/P1 nuclease [Candidatus Binataceae bacterium]
MANNALAWDSQTHRMIADLAIATLPPSRLKDFFSANSETLQQYSTYPDTVLRDRYGRAEERRHFIDLEVYGSDPWSVLVPDRAAMIKKFGVATLDRSGTLPWTIEEVADESRREWKSGNCPQVLRLSGYLAHYVGDASQPLHSTIHYDGYNYRDRGVHARIEKAVDLDLNDIYRESSMVPSVVPVSSVWDVATAEIRDASKHVNELIEADRSARRGSDDREDYDRKLMKLERPLFAWQIHRAASVLASIWLYEWHQAGSPIVCQNAIMRNIVPAR